MPEIKFFPETHVVFVSRVGPYEKSIKEGFRKLFEWLEEQRVHPVGQSLGIFYDDPTKVAAENLRCDLCSPVGPEVEGTGQVRTKEIGGWKVATLDFEGEENSRPSYEHLYNWLHEQGYHEADAPIEKYLSRLGERLKVELAVPIVEKKHLPGTQKVKSPEKKTTTATAAKKTARPTKTTKPKTTRSPRKSE